MKIVINLLKRFRHYTVDGKFLSISVIILNLFKYKCTLLFSKMFTNLRHFRMEEKISVFEK